MSDVIDIFKTPLYFAKLKLDNKKMASYCTSMSQKHKGRKLSNAGGWQSDNLSGEIPVLNNLFLNIIEHSNKMADIIGLKKPLKLDNIWININGFKDSNITHVHNHCLLSGVYYVKTSKNCADLMLNNPALPLIECDWNGYSIKGNYTNYTAAKHTMPAYEGMLYIFPSWLEHYVSPNMSKQKRISISFNIIR